VEKGEFQHEYKKIIIYRLLYNIDVNYIL